MIYLIISVDPRCVSKVSPEDGDGLLASRLAVHLLLGRGAGKQSSQMAVAAVDVRGSGASDGRKRAVKRSPLVLSMLL